MRTDMPRPTLALKLALTLALTLALVAHTHAQGRLVMQGNAWIVIDNAATVVLENPATNAITLGAGGGNIRSEAENDRLIWRIGTGSGSYVIPWTNGNGVKIPLTVNLTTPGTGAGSFVLSTHTDFDAVNNWDNFDYRPSDVTTMNGFSIGNNSASVIDRFWRIEGSGYTTMPQATLGFAYDDAERTATGNTIPAGTLFAQRFSVPANGWLLPGLGTDNFPTLTVTGANVTTDFHKSWTLTTLNTPLPAAALDFSAQREGSSVRLDWALRGNAPVQRYHLERQEAGGGFERLSSHAAGDPAYVAWDRMPLPGLNTYRVLTEDFNGQLRASELRSVLFGGEQVRLFPHPLGPESNLQLLGFEGQQVQLRWVDMAGRVVKADVRQVEEVMEAISVAEAQGWAAGVYVLHVQASGGFSQALRLVVGAR